MADIIECFCFQLRAISKSENADMSNEKSCDKHDRLPQKGFLRSVNLRGVNGSLRNP